MKSRCLVAALASAVVLTTSGCHYDEPYHHSHHRRAYHGSYHGRSYHDGYSSHRYRRSYDYDHRAAEHDEHDYYDHGY